VWLAAFLGLAGCGQTELSTRPDSDAQVADAGEDENVLAKIPESVRLDLSHGRARDVLVELADRELPDAGQPEAEAAADGDAGLARSVQPEDMVSLKAERYRRVQEHVLSQLVSDSVEVKFQYVNVPLLFVGVRDLPGLVELARMRDVIAVHENVRMEHELTESLPLIQQPAAATANYLGAGTSVAVLDTGCDFTRAAFGSCTAAGAANCKVAYAADFGPNDNVRDTNGHGTNVSAIVLGVAPSTKVLALDVFESTTASSSTILQAIDWVITNRAKYNIVAMNMSLGSGLYTSTCADNVFASAVANARSAGILSSIASGNTASSTSISSPACVPTAISVGAVYDANVGGLTYGNCSDSTTAADKVTCFSNSASFLSMLAPGAPITAGGYTMTGTSQAAPHVAGAIAVARAAFPTEPINATFSRLTTTGPTITDPRNGVAVHRLDLNAATGGTGVVDVDPPTGSMQINAGAAATRTTGVALALTASDDGGAITMCVSNTTTCTAFTPFSTVKNWTITAGDGIKTVYVTLRDPAGNRTVLNATIRLDITAPTGATLTATPSAAQVALTWTNATDTGSGVASYKVQAATNTMTAPSCTSGTTIYNGSANTFTHSGLMNGVPYAYRVCPIDVAGNVGMGPTASARPAPEFDGPTGTVSINQDAQYANKAAVTLSLAATDASGVATMCISNTTTCASFVPFAATKAWSMTAGNGTQTVRVWFKDIYGNVSTAAASDSIILDMTAPTTSTLSAQAGDASVALSWTASSDASSGLAGYRIMSALNTPPTCTSGTMVYSGTAQSTTHTGLSNGSLYAYRVCPFDVAGNVMMGTTITARPAPEFDGPVGTVVINQDAMYTRSKAVTLTLTASDASGVASACVSNAATGCTAYTTFASSRAWTLTIASGTATVRVWFKDIYGNVSAAAASDTIIVDTTAPTASTLSAQVSSGAVTLSWAAATDAGSGLAGYRLRTAPNAAPSCTSGTEIYSGTDRTFMHTGLSAGSAYGYRICPYDVAGNVASGGMVVARPQ
jgi:hypothetical protein